MSKVYKRNLTPKIIAILFSLMLWIYVMTAINPRITNDISNVNVQIMNIDEIRQQGLVVVGDQNYNIRVRLTGRRDEVQRITRDQITARADLMGYSIGLNNVPVEVFVDGQVDVEFSPKFISLELEEIVRRQKDVEIQVEGSPGDGFVVGSLEFKPTVVWVQGPESIVNQVNKVVAKLELDGERRNIAQSLALRPVNSRGVVVQNVEVQTPFADVILVIDEVITVPVESQVTFSAAPGYVIREIIIEPSTMALKGQRAALAGILSVKTDSRVINNLIENTQITVPILLPEGVEPFDTNLVRIRAVVDRITEKRLTIPRNEIVVNNLGNGLVVDINSIPENIDVRIVGAESTLDIISNRNLKIVLDVAGLQAGYHTIRVAGTLPNNLEQGVNELVINPQYLNIRIAPRGAE